MFDIIKKKQCGCADELNAGINSAPVLRTVLCEKHRKNGEGV